MPEKADLIYEFLFCVVKPNFAKIVLSLCLSAMAKKIIPTVQKNGADSARTRRKCHPRANNAMPGRAARASRHWERHLTFFRIPISPFSFFMLI